MMQRISCVLLPALVVSLVVCSGPAVAAAGVARGDIGTTSTTITTLPPEDVCVAPEAGLTGWWAGDCDAIDLAGTSDGTLMGGVAVLPGRVRNAFWLDGVDDYVTMPHDAAFNPTGPFSVDLWMKAPAEQNGQVLLVDKSHGFTDGTGWAVQSEPDGRVAFFFGGGGGATNFTGVGTEESLFDDAWHHLAGVWTGTRFEIWVDGALDATADFDGAPVNNNRGLEIGSAWGGGARTRYYRGALDEVAYTDRALGAEEIEALFEAGSAGRCRPACAPGQCVDFDAACKACGQPVSSGAAPNATDALSILRTAVNLGRCRGCVCDVDGTGSIVATDALATLQRAVNLPVVLSCPLSCRDDNSAITLPDDFSSGLRPQYWSVTQTTPGLFSLDDSHGDIRLAKTAMDNPGGIQNIAVRLNMDVVGAPISGDFSTGIDFRDAVVPGPGIDQIELHAQFSDGSFLFVVYDNLGGTNVHVWNGTLVGTVPVAATAGTFTIARSGTTVTGSYNGSPIHSQSAASPLTQVEFVLQLQPGANDLTSVTFDSFVFSTAY